MPPFCLREEIGISTEGELEIKGTTVLIISYEAQLSQKESLYKSD
jgi:hypothetical protein